MYIYIYIYIHIYIYIFNQVSRPLRSATCPWGLTKLSLAELKQSAVGNSLLLRGIWLCVPVALCGGAVILEHPAPPLQPDRAAIWRTGDQSSVTRWMVVSSTHLQTRTSWSMWLEAYISPLCELQYQRRAH